MFTLIFSLFSAFFILFYVRGAIKYTKVAHMVQDCIDVGAIEEAMRNFKMIPIYKRDTPMSKWLQAQIYFNNGQYVIAMTKLQDIMTKRKYDMGLLEIDVRKLLIEVYNKTHMYKEAYELLLTTLKLDTKSVYINRELGRYFFHKEDYSTARYYLSVAVNSGADDFFTFYLLAKIEYSRNAYINSLSYIEKALAVNPNHPDALMLYAVLKFNAKNYTTADKIFNKLMVNDTYGSVALIYKAISQFNLNNFEEASSIAETILELQEVDTGLPVYMTFLKTYVEALIGNKKILEIEPLLNDILGIDPEDVFALNYKTVFQNIFKHSKYLLDLITLDRVEIKEKLSSFLNGIGYDISDIVVSDEEEYFFYAYPKEFNHNNILFIFSRGDYYVKFNSLKDYMFTAKNKKVAMLYVVTPYYFVDECFDMKDNKLLIKLHDGATLYRVLSNEIQL